MKKTKKSSQFPNIYRIITENHTYKRYKNLWIRLPNQSKLGKILYYFLILDFCVLVLSTSLATIVLGSRVFGKLAVANKISIERNELKRQISFWRSVLEKYPGYKDAYFRIALLEYKLGDLENAKKDNQKALLLDPNYKDARSLEVLIDKNY